MSELGYVELPILQWLSGHGSTTPNDPGLGWTYRDEAEMAGFERPLADPLVEPLLIDAILRINDHVRTADQARLAIKALRQSMANPDKLTANRETLDRLRDGVKVELVPGEDTRTVYFIELDPAKQHLNDFTVTNQYRVQGIKQCRDDTVLLVNGIPLVIAEYKSYLASGKEWTDGVHQLHRYQRQAPLMLAPNLFCVAADEEVFRYGTLLFHDATKDEIDDHLDTWGPWLSRYPERKGWWNEPEADDLDDPLEVPVRGLLRLQPCHLKELQSIADEVVNEVEEPKTLYLSQPLEYTLFKVLRQYSNSQDAIYLSDCARDMVSHLRKHQLLSPGWGHSRGGRMRVSRSLLVESWNPRYAELGFDPIAEDPPFLEPAVFALADVDAAL